VRGIIEFLAIGTRERKKKRKRGERRGSKIPGEEPVKDKVNECAKNEGRVRGGS